MIKDVIIIKDGIPLFSRNYCTSGTNSHKMFIEQNDLIMVSGFFSALNSFSEEFDNFGPIKELRLTNTELKLSFLKDRSIPNLIYLATFDDKSKGVNVQRALRKISRTFLTRYNIDAIANWSGRTGAFDDMRELIRRYIDEEKEENEIEFKEKIEDLFKNVEELIDGETKISQEKEVIIDVPGYFNYIPFNKTVKQINPRYYLSGESSHKVFQQIDGLKTVNQIAENLRLNQLQVYNVCKTLIKLGFIDLNRF